MKALLRCANAIEPRSDSQIFVRGGVAGTESKIMPHSERVGVIVVNWNSGDLLLPCVESIARQTIAPERVLIVDNASTDDSLGDLEERFPQFEVLHQPVNRGFACANNIAIERLVDVDWIALLNPDAIAHPDWLENLLISARRYPTVASFGSKMLRPGSDVLDGTGDVYHVSGLAWRRDHGTKNTLVDHEANQIFSPCGAAAFYRRDALKAVGGFDSRFFCYMEDVDLGFRLRLLGHQSIYVPSAVVEHVGSGITGRRSDFSVYFGHRNLVWTYFKNMPSALLYRYLLLHLVVNTMAVPRYTRRGQGGVVLKAKRDAFGGLKDILRSRREVQSSRTVSTSDLLQSMSTDYSALVGR